MGTFAGGIADYAKKTKLSIDDSVVAINSELFGLVAEKSPVLEGRFVSNWQVSFNSPSNETTDAVQSKQSKIKEAQLFAKNSAGKIMIMTNNLPYAYPLEYLSWSKKAPNGMVRISLLEIQSALRKFTTVK